MINKQHKNAHRLQCMQLKSAVVFNRLEKNTFFLKQNKPFN